MHGDWEAQVLAQRCENERHAETIFTLRAQLAEAQAKLEVAERDAARYRWFRTHENWRDSGPYDDLFNEELDAAVDAQLAIR